MFKPHKYIRCHKLNIKHEVQNTKYQYKPYRNYTKPHKTTKNGRRQGKIKTT